MMDEWDGRKVGRKEEGRVEGWKDGRMEGWKVRGLYGWKKEAQSNRMCYRYIKMAGVGRRITREEWGWRKKHNQG